MNPIVLLIFALLTLTTLLPQSNIPTVMRQQCRELSRELLGFALYYPSLHPSELNAGLGHFPCPDRDGDGRSDGPCRAGVSGTLPLSVTSANGQRNWFGVRSVLYNLHPALRNNPAARSQTSATSWNAQDPGGLGPDNTQAATLSIAQRCHAQISMALLRRTTLARAQALDKLWQTSSQHPPAWFQINRWPAAL